MIFKVLARETPEYPFLQQLLGETLAEQRDIDGALHAYRTALASLVSRQDVASHRDAIRHRIALLHLSRSELIDAGSMWQHCRPNSIPVHCTHKPLGRYNGDCHLTIFWLLARQKLKCSL